MKTRVGKRMKQATAVAGLSLALWTGGAVLAPIVATPAMAMATTIEAQQEPQRPKPQDDFVPVDELPPEQKLPAAQFLIAAYAIVWLGVTGYVWSLWRRLGRVEQELSRVAKRP